MLILKEHCLKLSEIALEKGKGQMPISKPLLWAGTEFNTFRPGLSKKEVWLNTGVAAL